jgi:glycogen debranching enzyme
MLIWKVDFCMLGYMTYYSAWSHEIILSAYVQKMLGSSPTLLVKFTLQEKERFNGMVNIR